MSAFAAGVLVVTPIYLAVVLLLAAMRSVARLVAPLAEVLPDWFPAEKALSLLLVLSVCFLVGVAVRTRRGQATQARADQWLVRRVPLYEVCRSLTHRIAGIDQQSSWQPALVEIEEALVPGFIIEELDDGRFTVFVPSVPTPLTGAVYILSRERVHALQASFTQTVKAVSRWGAGSKDLVAAMSTTHPASDGEREGQDAH